MQNRKIGIIMIGHSGAGKTCYLYTMYSEMALGVNGFAFTPTDYDQCLQLENGWEGIMRKELPSNSIKSTDYNFRLTHNFESLLVFSWHDYRGGALTEDASSADREALFKRIEESSCLIYCIPSDKIVALCSNSAILKQSAYKEFRLLQVKLLEEMTKRGVRIPMVLAITKADQYAREELEPGVKALKETLSTLFKPRSQMLVMLVGLSIGQIHEIPRKDDGGGGSATPQTRRFEGSIEPKNIRMPVLFALYATLNHARSAALNERNSLDHRLSKTDDALSTEERKGFLARVFQGDDRSVYRSAARDIRSALQSKADELTKYEKDLDAVLSELQGGECEIYYNGDLINQKRR